VAESGREKDYEGENRQRHYPGDHEQENVESVHPMSHGGSLLRP
jgi:hypothetical protein